MCKWERFTNFLNKDVVKIHKEKKTKRSNLQIVK